MSDLIRSLRLFGRLTEEGNFSALARRQNLSHTTIARAIDDLEAHFGVRLFQRTTRRLVLTGDGERLLEHSLVILDQVAQAEADLAGAVAARGLVRIGVTTALGLHYAQNLMKLKVQHPELLIEFLFSDWRDIADSSGLDLWVTVGGFEEYSRDEGGSSLPDAKIGAPFEAVGPLVSGLESIRNFAQIGSVSTAKLGELQRVLVASPDYVERCGLPSHPSDLMGHDCLTYGYAARSEPWVIDGEELRVRGFLRANTSEAILRAVRGGLGVGMLPHLQVADDIARGDLIWILPNAQLARLSIKVAHGFKGMRMPMRARVALQFLSENFPTLIVDGGREPSER